MSTILIQITDHAFKNIIKDAFKEGAEVAKKQLEKENQTDDIIKEYEALKLLDCGKSKLAKLRADRKIVFYTTSRPYSYSRNSIVEHKNSLKVG